MKLIAPCAAPRFQRSAFVWVTVFVIVAWLLTDADPVQLLIAKAIVGILWMRRLAVIGGLAGLDPRSRALTASCGRSASSTAAASAAPR